MSKLARDVLHEHVPFTIQFPMEFHPDQAYCTDAGLASAINNKTVH